MSRPTSLALLAGALACNTPPADTGFASGQPGTTSAPDSSSSGGGTTSSSTDDPSTSSTEDSAAGTTEPIRDVGSAADFGPSQPPGCKGKIDFLFLISRGYEMGNEQQRLLDSIPGFIDTIETTFPTFDTHIMVANPEGTWTGWACEKSLCENDAPYCGENGKDYVCGPTSYEQVTECDEILGAGLLFNAGPHATNVPCKLAGGNRYITSEEPDLLAAFDCIARVGTYGDTPPMGDALIAALSPDYPVGKCNKGFIRKDALLFITIIADFEDVSKSYPPDWYDAILNAKQGDAEAVVTLLVTAPYNIDPAPGCTYNNDHQNPLRDTLTKFPYHYEGDICAPSFAPYFTAAAALVDEACEKFVPQ
jgi:hypothetical protein